MEAPGVTAAWAAGCPLSPSAMPGPPAPTPYGPIHFPDGGPCSLDLRTPVSCRPFRRHWPPAGAGRVTVPVQGAGVPPWEAAGEGAGVSVLPAKRVPVPYAVAGK